MRLRRRTREKTARSPDLGVFLTRYDPFEQQEVLVSKPEGHEFVNDSRGIAGAIEI
jgi:hypothetical protein